MVGESNTRSDPARDPHDAARYGADGSSPRAVSATFPPQSLDERGRCCGRKPLTYKRDGYRFCDRCDRAYSLTTDKQITNWAFKAEPDGTFTRKVGS